MSTVEVGGPYFDDLVHGRIFDNAPGVTLTSGLGAVHQSILGDRLRLPLDASLSTAVTGADAPLAHPGLVCDVAIGQSTVATHHVKANLFYRGLRLIRAPFIGDTLYTTTEVVGLKENASKLGRPPTGLAALHMTTVDHLGRTVLDFYRCAMLPLHPNADPDRVRHADDLARIGTAAAAFELPHGWNLDAYRRRVSGPRSDEYVAGTVYRSSADVVSSAPELARATMNIAATHHDDRRSSTGRLVYGGHTIGIALSQACRALPSLLTVLGWHSCDHTGPVFEGDTLTSELTIETVDPASSGGAVVHLRSIVFAHRAGAEPAPVLDWRFAAALA